MNRHGNDWRAAAHEFEVLLVAFVRSSWSSAEFDLVRTESEETAKVGLPTGSTRVSLLGVRVALHLLLVDRRAHHPPWVLAQALYAEFEGM
jgi:hypothetical protein